MCKPLTNPMVPRTCDLCWHCDKLSSNCARPREQLIASRDHVYGSDSSTHRRRRRRWQAWGKWDRRRVLRWQEWGPWDGDAKWGEYTARGPWEWLWGIFQERISVGWARLDRWWSGSSRPPASQRRGPPHEEASMPLPFECRRRWVVQPRVSKVGVEGVWIGGQQHYKCICMPSHSQA